MNMENENGQEAVKKKSLIEKISQYLPSVEKPLYKQTFNTRLMWVGIALALYLVLANIRVIGIDPSRIPQLQFLEIVLASRFGSIMTLGIGPIVTAGIILQLLVGSKVINWDMSKAESKKKFQSWNKFLAVAFSFLEAIVFVMAGALPIAGGPAQAVFVIAQLAMGGVVVILLDEVVQKWGFGSGISLFIAAGVASQMVVRIASPLASTCEAWKFATCIPDELNPPAGLLWNSLLAMLSGRGIEALFSLLPILSTAVIFLVVIYVQYIHVDIPLAFSALRGFGKSWSLKLLYTSNIPVILTAALIANLQLLAHTGAAPQPGGGTCGLLGCFDSGGNAVSGIIYFLSINSNGALFSLLTGAFAPLEIVRIITYAIVLGVFSMVFSIFWVSTSGMDAKSVAGQIGSVGMQIPGYRRDPRIIESVLNRYIPSLALLGGLVVGLLAATADVIGAIGTGTGILLTVMIMYNYYEELRNQNLEDAHPLIRKFLGGE